MSDIKNSDNSTMTNVELRPTPPDQIVRTDSLLPTNTAPSAPGREKRSLVQWMGIGLIVLGLIVFCIPYFNDHLIREASQIDLNAISAEHMAQATAAAKAAGTSQTELIEEIGLFNVWGLLHQYRPDQIVAEISLPGQGIDLAVFSEASNENLLAGLAPLKDGQKLGEGNFTLSGHRAKGKGVLLHNLMDAQIGDRINITDKKDIYVYKVVDALQVETDAIDMLDDKRMSKYDNKPLISIMTCYYGRSSSRWFVVGALEKIIPYDAEEMNASGF